MESKKLERKEFIEIRNKIVEILLSTPETKAEASYLCASALNEVKANLGFCYRIQCHRAIAYADNDKI